MHILNVLNDVKWSGNGDFWLVSAVSSVASVPEEPKSWTKLTNNLLQVV